MPAKAKKITLYLGNGTLDGLVNISESDGWDLGGELFSCPRDNLSDLLNDDTIDKLGVYLLLSNKVVKKLLFINLNEFYVYLNSL